MQSYGQKRIMKLTFLIRIRNKSEIISLLSDLPACGELNEAN